MNLTDIIGTAAAVLTTLAFLPQAWRSWRTRDLAGISLGMYGLFTLGVFLWLLYGLLLGQWPIIVANAITLILSCSILFLKIRHA
ncbi:MAG: SemiSWEET transporter [Polynucleobacter sp.]|nr:SemiSWEET transporter [Polynucleobacter sp.]MDZ4057712.1 SemiSWEET transporter [Polynucleobacter sp.]